MRPSKPPTLASWMLEHLLLGGRNEALAGDLLEEFQRQGSVAWYRRQVLGAILASFSNELRADWVMVWTIVFSVVWAYALYVIPHFTPSLPPDGRFALRVMIQARFAWVVMVVSWNFLWCVVLPLSIYLAGARHLNLWGFTRGLCIAMPVTLTLQILPFQPLLDFLSLHGLANYWMELWKWYEVMHQFVPLLIAMWVAVESGEIGTHVIRASQNRGQDVIEKF